MSVTFTRTETGLVGSRYFYDEPIVWVEGPTDVYFYEPVLGKSKCKIRPFHGASNAEALIQGLKDNSTDYPYAIVLDGDYGVLSRKRSVHRWVVYLKRYSIENYLWEKDSLDRSCHKHAQRGERDESVGMAFDEMDAELYRKLRPVVELDIAARRADPAPKVMPDRIDELLADPTRLAICAVKVQRLIADSISKLPEADVACAKEEISTFLESSRLADVIPGHVLFGVIRKFFTQESSRIRGKKVIVNDDALMQLLCEMVWRIVPSFEHVRLRRKLLTVVREMNWHLMQSAHVD